MLLHQQIGQENGDGMRCPIQETSNGHAVQIPAGDGGQNCGLRVSVEETVQPNSRGMVPFDRHVIDDDTNAVSSGINEQEQAAEHTCSIEDFRLWKQHVNRHVNDFSVLSIVPCSPRNPWYVWK